MYALVPLGNYSNVTLKENCSKEWWFKLLKVHVCNANGEKPLNFDISGAQSIYGSKVKNHAFL